MNDARLRYVQPKLPNNYAVNGHILDTINEAFILFEGIMKKIIAAAAIAATTIFAAASASAATFGYLLADHPGGGMSSQHDYGLRLDRSNQFFSFGNGATAYLSYDDTTDSAVLFGTMRESLGLSGGVKTFGGLFNFEYFLTGVTNTGTGTFTDTSGSGNGTVFGAGAGGTDIALGAAARGNGDYFLFGADVASHNQQGAPFEGSGWVQSSPGANDFLFTATTSQTPVPPSNVSPVPLPAAGWLLVVALGGMGLMGRRKAA